MNAKMRSQLIYTFCCFMIMTIVIVSGGCSSKGSNAPPPATIYSNATLTGTWILKLTSPFAISTSFKFDGNGNMVESYGINVGTLPAPYNVQANGLYTVNLTGFNQPTKVFTGQLTSTTAGSVTTGDGSPVTGTLKKIMDLGACQGTWAGTLAGDLMKSFTIIVDNTGTITGGSGFTVPYNGKLFCESGDAQGLLTTGASYPLDQIEFNTGAVVSGATVTISGNYETNGGNGTYTLVTPPPATGYSNATLTGTWIIKLNTGVDIVTTGLKFDGNGNIVEMEVADNPLSPPTFPSPYAVQSNGSFTLTWTFSSAPTMTFTGTLKSLTTGSVTAVDGNPVTGYLRKVTDLSACQGTWAGTLAGSFTKSFTIIVDNTGTITGGSGFTVPYNGKFFCESGDATGSLITGATYPVWLYWIKFQTGTVVSGATVTISGNYETNGGNGTYTLVK